MGSLGEGSIEPPNGRRFEHHVVRLQRVAVAVVIDCMDQVLLMWRNLSLWRVWDGKFPGVIAGPTEANFHQAGRQRGFG